MRLADERQQMVLAHRIELDVFYENDLARAGLEDRVVDQLVEALPITLGKEFEGAGRARGSFQEPIPRRILADDQLGECDLTLRELTQIREAMIKSLVAIYHSRVDYPGYVPPTSGQFRFTGEVAEENGRTTRYADPADIPISKGGEIEDEAVDREPEPADLKTIQ